MHLAKSSALVFVAISLVRCAHSPATPANASSAPAQAALPKGTTADEVAAQSAYTAGDQTFRRGLYGDAIKLFEAVRTEHPYSRFAALSELRIADAHMARNQYLEAIDAYRNFLRFHPAHPDASYALGKVGEAYFAQIPSSYWFMPPAAEKDLANVRQAIATYQDLLARFPQADARDVAQKHLDACRAKLAEHELYVARFYAARKQWPGAKMRAQGLLADYPKLGFDAEALLILAQSQMFSGDRDDATKTVAQLQADYPETAAAKRAALMLAPPKGTAP